jgi:hypothetical protein
MFKEFNQYTQNLLMAQHFVSRIIDNPGILGTVREDFIIEAIERRFENPKLLKRGCLLMGEIQTNQVDIFLHKRNCQVIAMGEQRMVAVEDCLIMMEVKSTLVGVDLTKFNNEAAIIKQYSPDAHPVCGVFGYTLGLQKKTILRRLGYRYDAPTDTYVIDPSLPVWYPHIDFVIVVDNHIEPEDGQPQENNQLYLRLNRETNQFVLSSLYPTVQNLFSLFNNILMTNP